MRAARLRHRVTFQRQADAHNADGQPAGAWADVATVWAAVEPLRSDATYQRDQLREEVRTRIVTRYQASLRDPGLRVIHDGRCYRIDGVRDPDERHRELVCDAVEVQQEEATWQ